MKLFSEMEREELVAEMQRLRGEERKKRQAGFESEANVLEQKYYMVKSYLTPVEKVKVGLTYRVEGTEGVFAATRLEGVMVWGFFAGREEEVAVPLGRLIIDPDEKRNA